jgi:hypothetical protein
VRICIISALNEPVKEGALDSLAAVLDVEIKSALGNCVLNVRHDLLLDGLLVMSDVLPHQLPKLLRSFQSIFTINLGLFLGLGLLAGMT